MQKKSFNKFNKHIISLQIPKKSKNFFNMKNNNAKNLKKISKKIINKKKMTSFQDLRTNLLKDFKKE